MLPTFDEWFLAKYGGTFNELHQAAGMRYDDAFMALSRSMRDYVSELVKRPHPTTGDVTK